MLSKQDEQRAMVLGQVGAGFEYGRVAFTARYTRREGAADGE